MIERHEIHRVMEVGSAGLFRLRVKFEDGTSRIIDFGDVLYGKLFGPLRDPKIFDQVKLDEEAHTLVWPNGADFDPETLYNWDRYLPAMKAQMQKFA